jgi:hypothetical protein
LWRRHYPEVSVETRVLTGDLIMATFSAVGKLFSRSHRTPAEIECYAEALAHRLCAYVERVAQGSREE